MESIGAYSDGDEKEEVDTSQKKKRKANLILESRFVRSDEDSDYEDSDKDDVVEILESSENEDQLLDTGRNLIAELLE